MRAKYGEKLRRFFKQKTGVITLIDFGGYPVFEATVDTNIILFKKKQPDKTHRIRFVNVKNELRGKDLISFLEKNHGDISQEKLDDDCWTLADERILKLKEKIEKIGIPLKDWDVNIYRGITTGLNEVFVIDEKIKDELIREDKKSLEILKPILRGKDVYKWFYKFKDCYLIYTYTGIDIKKYPAIYKYLKQYKNKLEQVWEAKYGKKEWYELRGCDYYSEFEKEKIVWREIVEHSCFAWDSKSYFGLAKVFIMTGKECSKYLVAVLNSSLGNYAIKKYYAPFLGEKVSEFKKEWVQKFPVPKIPKSERQLFINLVNKILSLTQPACASPHADRSEDYLPAVMRTAQTGLENPQKPAYAGFGRQASQSQRIRTPD